MYCPQCDSSYPPGAKHCAKDGARLVKLVDRADDLIGKSIDGRFTIRERLGAGGMGSVYRAMQHSVGREVAIKVISPRHVSNKEVTKRFMREARLSSSLSQPNIVSIHDFGQDDDGLLYLVMEHLEGKSLDTVIDTEAPLAPSRAVRIAIQLCDALEAAHAMSIVHRDLKPGNVVILDHPPGRDMVKVLDFGIAKSISGDDSSTMTRTDMVLGSPTHISPEAAAGKKVDGRADLYAIGVMLYEMLTGELPFQATSINEMLVHHVRKAPTPMPVSLPEELRETVGRLLKKDPYQRFPSAAATRDALVALRPRLATTAPVPKGPNTAEKNAVQLAETDASGDLGDATSESSLATTDDRGHPRLAPNQSSAASAPPAMAVATPMPAPVGPPSALPMQATTGLTIGERVDGLDVPPTNHTPALVVAGVAACVLIAVVVFAMTRGGAAAAEIDLDGGAANVAAATTPVVAIDAGQRIGHGEAPSDAGQRIGKPAARLDAGPKIVKPETPADAGERIVKPATKVRIVKTKAPVQVKTPLTITSSPAGARVTIRSSKPGWDHTCKTPCRATVATPKGPLIVRVSARGCKATEFSAEAGSPIKRMVRLRGCEPF